MCLAALHAFRVDRLVYAADNDRLGAVVSALKAPYAEDHPYHRVAVTGGVLADPAKGLMKKFFRERRTRGAYNAAPPEDGPPNDGM